MSTHIADLARAREDALADAEVTSVAHQEAVRRADIAHAKLINALDAVKVNQFVLDGKRYYLTASEPVIGRRLLCEDITVLE